MSVYFFPTLSFAIFYTICEHISRLITLSVSKKIVSLKLLSIREWAVLRYNFLKVYNRVYWFDILCSEINMSKEVYKFFNFYWFCFFQTFINSNYSCSVIKAIIIWLNLMNTGNIYSVGSIFRNCFFSFFCLHLQYCYRIH